LIDVNQVWKEEEEEKEEEKRDCKRVADVRTRPKVEMIFGATWAD
jgi:hypothetical protein